MSGMGADVLGGWPLPTAWTALRLPPLPTAWTALRLPAAHLHAGAAAVQVDSADGVSSTLSVDADRCVGEAGGGTSANVTVGVRAAGSDGACVICCAGGGGGEHEHCGVSRRGR